MSRREKTVIVVHGGAWDVPQHLWHPSVEGVKMAARRGYQVLNDGGSVLDAVENAVISMENNPVFDAGTGSVLTLAGQVEMDSLMMEGAELKAGAVAAIRNVQNPIKVARLVLEKTPHVMLAGEGANEFAASHGLPEVAPETLITPHARQELEDYKKFSTSVDTLFNVLTVKKQSQSGHDTVGCAALDVYGHTACATSTGGITAKMPGRVGDTPVPGAGGYADDKSQGALERCHQTLKSLLRKFCYERNQKWDEALPYMLFAIRETPNESLGVSPFELLFGRKAGAISTTGHGESLMRVSLARHIATAMTSGLSVDTSIQQSLEYMKERIGGCGGAVAVSRGGEVGVGFSTPLMPWAYMKDGLLHYGLHQGEHLKESL